MVRIVSKLRINAGVNSMQQLAIEHSDSGAVPGILDLADVDRDTAMRQRTAFHFVVNAAAAISTGEPLLLSFKRCLRLSTGRGAGTQSNSQR